jgi:NAD(P)-dependent dehydrogenase (short-subunit alcohol dehydrogenase family)
VYGGGDGGSRLIFLGAGIAAGIGSGMSEGCGLVADGADGPRQIDFWSLGFTCSWSYTSLHLTLPLRWILEFVTFVVYIYLISCHTQHKHTMKIADRTFIISGGVSGLGLATARALHAQGAYVSLLDLNADNGAKTVSEFGSRSKFFETDVSSTEAIADAIKGTVAWVKETGKEIGGVIAGAGVGLPGLIVDKKNEPLSIESIDFVLNINLRGTLDLIRQTVPLMTTATPQGPDGERGVIIMIASSAAFDGQMGQVSYAASKGAVASLTLPLARDLSKYGIRAVTIAPSMFDSAMTKMMSKKVKQSLESSMEFPKRAGLPEEFARMVIECVGNEMLNGTVLRLDGAMRMPARL